jgi:large subunit ribosomal protein L6
MSRVGVKPVPIPAGVTVKAEGRTVAVKGPKGELTWTAPAPIAVTVDGGQVVVTRSGDEDAVRALHGSARSLIANMVRGVQAGYEKNLEIQGVGYRAALQGRTLVLNIGFSHPVEFAVPAGITIAVQDGTKLAVSGPDKHLVGEVSAQIRSFYKAEPYKGKGIRYRDEYVRRKAGKTVA